MNLDISSWKLFILESQGKEYVSFKINSETYQLSKNVEVFGRKNVFSIELDPSEIIKNNFLDQFEKKLKINNINKVYFRIKPLQKQEKETRKAITLLKKRGFDISEINLIMLNLDSDEINLRKNLRKSYKSLINKESRILNIKSSIDNSEIKELFKDWIDTYKKAISRGGKKISNQTFDHLFNAIKKNECILVGAYNKNNFMGGMIFSISKNFAIYNSSANIEIVENDKTRSVGHFLMWNSILILKKFGIKHLELGTFYNVDANSDYLKKWISKEDGITKFKNGFGGDIIKSYYILKESIK